MSRPKKNSRIREEMCKRFVAAMTELDLNATELSRALGYTNATTIARVQRGEAFVDTERLRLFSKLRTPQGKCIDLNWLISGDQGAGETGMAFTESLESSLGSSGSLQAAAMKRSDRPTGSLAHVAKWSFGQRNTGNVLIHGDNLDVLKGMAAVRPGSIKCAYLDPPYNNGESYSHYYDSMGHDEWLHAVTKRLELVKDLLREDGSVWISIDDSELHYLKVAADEVFGRVCFVGTIIWERRTTRENRKALSRNHEYLLVYAKNVAAWTKARNTLPLSDEVKGRYKNPDSDPRGSWQSVSANVQSGHATPQQHYGLKAPNGSIHWPPKGRCWIYSAPKMYEEIEKNNIWFGGNGNSVPRIKKFLVERTGGLIPETLWRASVVGTTSDAKKQLLSLFKETTLFDTPKPEQLISRILHISTNPGDLVLDPYLGSGTTAAVAHKMSRSYIGIESGEHIKTHCVHRLRQVIDGEPGGTSAELNWKGGGGFDFFRVTRSEVRAG